MILCCGEALIDMLPRRTAADEPAFSPCAGGAVFNTAIALGRLGVKTSFFSGLSTHLFGVILADTLAARVAPGGRIALSGILIGQEDELLARYSAWFDALQVTREDDWVRIDGNRR